MPSKWLFHWNIDQNKPTVELPSRDDMVSYAAFPENEQSFVLFDGYLFDKHKFQVDQKLQDASRIIEYYRKYGAGLFSKLRGGFSFIIWDNDRKCLFAGRDGMGLTPFYYFWDNKNIIISSSMKALLNHPDIKSGFNRIVIAEHIMHRWTDYQRNETFFENIQRLPPAHYIKLQDHQLSFIQYWDPVPPGFEWATDQESRTFPDVFRQAVERTLEVGADSIALSGGFDSVSIAVMANEILTADSQEPLHAVSLRYLNTGIDEGKVQMAVAKALNMPQTIRSVDFSLAGVSVLQASLDMSHICPIPVINIWQSFFSGLMNTASEKNLSRLLMGTGGDEMFIVDSSWSYDLLAAFQLKQFFHYFRTVAIASPLPITEVAKVLVWQRALKPLSFMMAEKILGNLAHKIKNIIRPEQTIFPPWVSGHDKVLLDTLKERISNPVPVELKPGEGAYVRAIRKLPQSPLLMIENEQAYFRAKYSNFALLYPYFDTDLMDLALRMRPEHLLRNSMAKAPLRNFVFTRLPSVQLPTKKVNFTQTAHELLRSEGKLAWSRLENAEMLENMDIIDRNNLNDFMYNYFEGYNNQWIYAWLIISTETWLRTYLNHEVEK